MANQGTLPLRTPKSRWSWAEAVMKACAAGELEDLRPAKRKVHKRAMVAVASTFALCFVNDETLVAWPGAAALAPLCGLSQKQVEHALAALDTAGWFVEVGKSGRAIKRLLNLPTESDLGSESEARETDPRSEPSADRRSVSTGPQVRTAGSRYGPTVPPKRTYGPAETDLRSDQPRQEPRQEQLLQRARPSPDPAPLDREQLQRAARLRVEAKLAAGEPVKSPSGLVRRLLADWAEDDAEAREILEAEREREARAARGAARAAELARIESPDHRPGWEARLLAEAAAKRAAAEGSTHRDRKPGNVPTRAGKGSEGSRREGQPDPSRGAGALELQGVELHPGEVCGRNHAFGSERGIGRQFKDTLVP